MVLFYIFLQSESSSFANRIFVSFIIVLRMERSTCQVQNVEDKTMMTMTIEWSGENMKITVLRSGMVPLTGQTTVTQLREYVRNEMPREQYVIDLKKELSGKEKETHFMLKESRLTWKKKIWRRGMIELQPIVDIVALSDVSLEWLNDNAILHETSSRQHEDDEARRKRMDELTMKIKDMEATKKRMEDTLYRQFLAILNTKKRKIRELEDELKNQKNIANASPYNDETDNSTDELEESSDPHRKVEKRVRTSSPNKDDASTSKISKTLIKSSPESEDEIVLKFVDSQEDDTKLNMEEDPEADLFSQ